MSIRMHRSMFGIQSRFKHLSEGKKRGSATFHEFRISNTRIAAQLRVIYPGMDGRVINDVGMRRFIRLFVYVFVDGK